MSANVPVSAVVPGLDDFELLEKNLPVLAREIAGTGGEIVLVDDTGRAVVEPWVRGNLPDLATIVRVVSRPTNGGFAAAALDGVREAKHDAVFLMNPDILVREGFLPPLLEHLAGADVHSVVPRILLFGREDSIESVVEIDFDHDVAYVEQRALSGEAEKFLDRPRSVTYAIGGAMLLRRGPFVAQKGFDPLYEPFYYEDVDLGFAAWAAGERVVYEPSSVVEHHHRGTIRSRVDGDLVRAVIERNRYLFQWKFVDGDEAVRRHLAALYRTAIDAYQRDQRRELVWLLLALDRLDELERSRAARPRAVRTFDEVVRESALIEVGAHGADPTKIHRSRGEFGRPRGAARGGAGEETRHVVSGRPSERRPSWSLCPLCLPVIPPRGAERRAVFIRAAGRPRSTREEHEVRCSAPSAPKPRGSTRRSEEWKENARGWSFRPSDLRVETVWIARRGAARGLSSRSSSGTRRSPSCGGSSARASPSPRRDRVR
ncbi:MAG: glycosyltransferase family 2 protein [Planctomycetota bacterium]